MEFFDPSDLPNTLSMLPGYPQIFISKHLWFIVVVQLIACITLSFLITNVLYRKLYPNGNISWKKAIDMTGPMSKRLKNLEKERTVWNCYLEWMEDYCNLYNGLLKYLNTTVINLEKCCSICKSRLSCVGGNSDKNLLNRGASTKGSDFRFEGETSSDTDGDRSLFGDEFLKLCNFTKALNFIKSPKPNKFNKSDQSWGEVAKKPEELSVEHILSHSGSNKL